MGAHEGSDSDGSPVIDRSDSGEPNGSGSTGRWWLNSAMKALEQTDNERGTR